MEQKTVPRKGTAEASKRTLEEAWSRLHIGITKIRNLIESKQGEPELTSEFYSEMYTIAHNLCSEAGPIGYPRYISEQCFKRYKSTFEEYIIDLVLPGLRGKIDEPLLRALVKRWNKYKIMQRLLSRFFSHLDRFYIGMIVKSPDLSTVAVMCFRDQVYAEMKDNVKDAMITLIDHERDGEEIDRELLKNVSEIFVTMGLDSIDVYKSDFELPVLTDTAAYYSSKAESWKGKFSLQDYMLKVEECLKKEKERVGHYLHPSTEEPLLEKVQHALLPDHTLKNEQTSDDLKKEPWNLFENTPPQASP